MKLVQKSRTKLNKGHSRHLDDGMSNFCSRILNNTESQESADSSKDVTNSEFLAAKVQICSPKSEESSPSSSSCQVSHFIGRISIREFYFSVNHMVGERRLILNLMQISLR